jgi:hemerythrin-like domain-containing protein
MAPCELLTEEHASIKEGLSVLNAMTGQVERGVPIDRHDVNALLIFFHYFADECHQAKEESILFPALQSSDREDLRNELDPLIAGHAEERALIEEVQFLLFTDQQREFILNARKLNSLLSQHMANEEHTLFPLVERVLPSRMAADVAMRMQEANAKFGERQRRLLIEMLEYLQKKYTDHDG